MEFYADSRLLGTATNAPYTYYSLDQLLEGEYAMTAKLIDRQGRETVSAPVHITVESYVIARLNAIYQMPTGQIRIHINTSPGYGWALEASEDLIHWDYALGTASGFGLYVDETSPLRPRRFFRLHEQVGRIRR